MGANFRGIDSSGDDVFNVYGKLEIESGGELNVKSGGALQIAGTAITASAAELNYVDGVTSPIQTQLNAAAGLYKEVTVSSEELLALHTTPKELVAAPGAGKILEFVSALLIYDKGATPYTIGNATDLQVKYTDGSGAAVSATRAVTGFLDQADDKIFTLPMVGVTAIDVSAVTNKALVLTLAGTGEMTLGDGVLRVKVAYRVHTTGL